MERSQGSATAPSRSFENGAVSAPAWRAVASSAGPARAAVSATPRSARSAAAGRSAAPRWSGAMRASKSAHCAAAAAPPSFRIIARYFAPSATHAKVLPPGAWTVHWSYATQRTASPTALSACLSGLLEGAPTAPPMPAKKEGPASNLYFPPPPPGAGTAKPCAAPPA